MVDLEVHSPKSRHELSCVKMLVGYQKAQIGCLITFRWRYVDRVTHRHSWVVAWEAPGYYYVSREVDLEEFDSRRGR